MVQTHGKLKGESQSRGIQTAPLDCSAISQPQSQEAKGSVDSLDMEKNIRVLETSLYKLAARMGYPSQGKELHEAVQTLHVSMEIHICNLTC